VPFADLFSGSAGSYARFRPSYPPALFAALAERAPHRKLALDCAAGSGQAAQGLAPFFARVVAADAAIGQLAAASPHPNVRFVSALAERCPLAAGSVALVTIAQALHWVDRPTFFREVRRVLGEGGVLAAWCYTLAEVGPDVDAVVRRFYDGTIGAFWLPGRRLVEEGYGSVKLPFEPFQLDGLAIERDLTLPEFVGYVATWSAVKRCREATGRDPMPAFTTELAEVWGEPNRRRPVRWSLHVRAGVR
jgi:SAM-dependent methyltransferase